MGEAPADFLIPGSFFAAWKRSRIHLRMFRLVTQMRDRAIPEYRSAKSIHLTPND